MTKDISIVVIETDSHELAKQAIDRTLQCVDAKEVITVSDKEFYSGARNVYIHCGTPFDKICQMMLKGMGNIVNTEHALFVQWDGMAYDKNMWDDDFLKFDYIGAPWPFIVTDNKVGNGGFSLRSKKLMDKLTSDPRIKIGGTFGHSEDAIICQQERKYLEYKYGIEFADIDTASRFSLEIGDFRNSFGFHGPWNVIRCMEEQFAIEYIDNMPLRVWADVYKCRELLHSCVEVDKPLMLELCLSKISLHSPEIFPKLEVAIDMYVGEKIKHLIPELKIRITKCYN